MPHDTLGNDLVALHRAATDYLHSKVHTPQQQRLHLRNLKGAISQLSDEIDERTTTYLQQLDAQENSEIESKRKEINSNPRVQRAYEAQQANHKQFGDLRLVNGGGYPRNI